MLRSGSSGIQAKGPGVCKAVKHLCAAADAVNGEAVELLVEKEAGFLSVFYIHDITDTVFCDADTAFCDANTASFDAETTEEEAVPDEEEAEKEESSDE